MSLARSLHIRNPSIPFEYSRSGLAYEQQTDALTT